MLGRRCAICIFFRQLAHNPWSGSDMATTDISPWRYSNTHEKSRLHTMSKEHRAHRRTPLRDIEGTYGKSDVAVLNASRGGLCLKGSSPLPVGKTFLVRLEVDGRALHVSGTVSWCRLIGTTRVSSSTVNAVYQGGMEYDLGSRKSQPLSSKLRY